MYRDYKKINLDRLHWLFAQYGTGFEYIKRHMYKRGFASLEKGLATKKQDMFLRSRFEVYDPYFFTTGGLPDPDDFFSKEIIEARASRNTIDPTTMKVMIRAKWCRDRYMQFKRPLHKLWHFDVDTDSFQKTVDDAKSYLDINDLELYHDVRDRFTDKGVLIFSGTASRQWFLLPPDIKAIILKYDEYPIIIIRESTYDERHTRAIDLIRLFGWLIYSKNSVIIEKKEFERNEWINKFTDAFGYEGYYSSKGRYKYWDGITGVLSLIHGYGYDYCKTGVYSYLDELMNFDFLVNTYFRGGVTEERVMALLAYFAIEEDRT